ncbi:amidohydrolase [Fusobacterium ulcerans]|uniref:amidohydrolase n=1 Tax=Fusobacterium ulcerans TaxID=861 RepID=UPI00103282D5|nr:amidohydrolase [Fusobacterium ulcerans]
MFLRQNKDGMLPDTIIYNGRFVSMNERGDIYSLIGIKDGKIIEVSKSNLLDDKLGFGVNIINLEGKTVLPGFYDCNVHAVQNGIGHYCIKIETKKREEFLKRLQKTVKEYKRNQLIWCIGFNWEEKERLNRWDLDKISSLHPIVVSKDEIHSTIVNTYAYNLLAIPSTLNGVEKDEKGMPTGYLFGEASGFARKKIQKLFINYKMKEQAMKMTVEEALRNGVTTMNAMEGGAFFDDEDIDIVQRYEKKNKIDLSIYAQNTDIEKAVEFGLEKIGGNFYLDGTISSKTAALYEPYENELGNYGILYFTQEELNRFVLDAHKKNMQIALSCIGERAIDQALEAYENAIKIYGRKNHRHRLEHFVLPNDEQIKRAVQLGLIFSMQPGYDNKWGGKNGKYIKNIGERYKRANPIGKIIKFGGVVVGGSESNITPLSPIYGIYSAINHTEEENRINIDEAIKIYTVNAAYANFEEKRKGKIERGFDADLVVLDRDIFTIKKEQIKDVKILKTIKYGELVYG